MIKLLICLLMLGSVSAFAAKKKIECKARGYYVTLDSSYSSFAQVESVSISNNYGKSIYSNEPNCFVISRESAVGSFVIINCEFEYGNRKEQKLVVNQYLAEDGVGEAILQINSRSHVLNCKNI